MGWKNWSAWLKGTIIGLIIPCIYLFLTTLFFYLVPSGPYAAEKNFLLFFKIFISSFTDLTYVIVFFVIYCFLIGLIIDKKRGPITQHSIATISFLIPWAFFIVAAIIIILTMMFSGEAMVGIFIFPLAGFTFIISFICMLVGLKLNYKKPEKTTIIKMAEEKAKPSMAKAIVALILNIPLPGLGSIIGGRTQTGILQLILFIVIYFVPWLIISFFYIAQSFLFLLGTIYKILIAAIWIWGIITGIQIIKEAVLKNKKNKI